MNKRQYRPAIDKACEHCGKIRKVKQSRLEAGKDRFCSPECFSAWTAAQPKACFKCGDSETKMKEEGRFFHSNGYCNSCSSEYSKKRRWIPETRERLIGQKRARYVKNRDQILQEAADLMSRRKREAIDYYGGKCACCGESEIAFLAIDHAHGRGSEHRKQEGISGANMYQWLKKNKYPDGFRVLCYNCNCALGFFGYCPHGNVKIEDPEKAPYIKK